MAALDPHFIDGPSGRLFLVHHVPTNRASRRALIVVPALFEEMNKGRRQVALTARALAARGIGVLVPDVRGTGDSEGELGDATIPGFVDDLHATVDRARELGYEQIDFLAVRAGALLAVALMRRRPASSSNCVLWQPVTSGKTLINQFLRLRAAAGLMANGAGVGVRDLRERLAGGRGVEVAGYALSAAFVDGMDALELAGLQGVARVGWLQIGRADDTPGPAARRVLDAWAAEGIACDYRGVTGDPFWATAEIATVPALSPDTAELLAAPA